MIFPWKRLSGISHQIQKVYQNNVINENLLSSYTIYHANGLLHIKGQLYFVEIISCINDVIDDFKS